MKKTKMKIMSLLLSMVLFLFVPFLNIQAASNHPARLVDQAELLTAEEQQQIQAKLDEVSELHHCDAVVMTVNSLEGKTATEYADDAFDYDGYGLGEDKAGILFLVDMGDRNWATSTHGYAITAFTDAGIQYVGGQMLDSLADGDYAEAFRIYAACCDDLIDQARAGHPFDEDDVPRKPMSPIVPLVCIVIGAALGIAVVQGMKAQLKSVRKEKSAANYVRPGSMNLTGKQDLFLYSNVNRVKRETKSSSSGGGGSSTHRSSSGTTHGGGGGKF